MEGGIFLLIELTGNDMAMLSALTEITKNKYR